MAPASQSRFDLFMLSVRQHGQGIFVSVIVAIAAKFLSEHYGAPAMLMALLLGIALHFLVEDKNSACAAGVDFSGRTILRFGVALLGARISMDLVMGLGAEMIGMVVAGVLLTILFSTIWSKTSDFSRKNIQTCAEGAHEPLNPLTLVGGGSVGLLGTRLLRRGWRFGVLTGGSVAICGASAAMAISAILPKNEHSERNLIFTVLSVTILSTMAMIIYPILSQVLALNDDVAGVFIGGTIHDVAQVIGAGFSVSDRAGEVATLVKLIRVAMLAPVVVGITLIVRQTSQETEISATRPPILPLFVLGFLGVAVANSLGLIPEKLLPFLSGLSQWALLVSIAAVGMKTSLKKVLDVGSQAIVLIIAETLFIATFVLAGVMLLR